jgi:hypothetical protein
MPTRLTLNLLMACFLTTGCAALPAARETPTPPRFAITADGNGNAVTVSADGETAIFDVRSPRGIGAAAIELVAGTPPPNIRLRLHLKGLEEFQLSHEQTRIVASLSSGASQHISQRLSSPAENERPITAASPYWLSIQIVSAQAVPRIPLTDGHFEITLPKNFLRDGQRAFSIRWIDFYR